MRTKSPKTVVTFGSTSDAMGFEVTAREHGMPGRIIPVPSEIDAGCGLAWCADEEQHDELMAAIQEHALSYEGVFNVMLY